MTALNQNGTNVMVHVYFENVHNISMYIPKFNCDGCDIKELKLLVQDYLNLSEKVIINIFNKKLGVCGRKLILEITNNTSDVYVFLKVEDDK